MRVLTDCKKGGGGTDLGLVAVSYVGEFLVLDGAVL
jgi:hypothetical protein